MPRNMVSLKKKRASKVHVSVTNSGGGVCSSGAIGACVFIVHVIFAHEQHTGRAPTQRSSVGEYINDI